MIRNTSRLLAGAAALFALAFPAYAADAPDLLPVPKLSGRVVDLAGVLNATERGALAAKLAAFEAAKGSQVTVLVMASIGTEPIEEFATRVTDEWRLGRAGVDDGVLFVIAQQERRMRIQTGRGVQGVLTDALSKRILAERVSPRFRAGDFAGGIEVGVDAILKAIEGESLPAPGKPVGAVGGTGVDIESLFWIAFLVVPIAGKLLRSVLGRFLGAVATSGGVGVVLWFVFGSVLMVVIGAVLTFVMVLLMGASALAHAAGGGGWSGGGSSGGGWSGGGGDSFSGGGGSFDGGGASGDW